MKTKSIIVMQVLLLALMILLFEKGFELRTLGSTVDGSGIGVSFLMFEVNDQVSASHIPVYAKGFLIAGICVAILLGGLSVKQLYRERN